jgi:hypothetical protein
MRTPACVLAFGALLLGYVPAHAQQVASLAYRPAAFASLRSAFFANKGIPAAPPENGSPPHRARNALIGGAVGVVAGLAVCTAISNLVNEGTGFSTCTRKGYLLLGGAGFGVGFAVGWLL